MISLDIRPFEGVLPIRFGLSRPRVVEILGAPDSSDEQVDSWGRTLDVNIGYDELGAVNQLGLGPGEYELTIGGQLFWTPHRHPDPNPTFLALDPEPLERVGFLVFTKLGIATTGYHDDDPGQYAISVYPRGAWDELLLQAKRPSLHKYTEAPN
jgi:hypothetical protein